MSGSTLKINLKVNYRSYSWEELVLREWGTAWGIPDNAYEFSNGATRWSTDLMRGGIYTKGLLGFLEKQSGQYPDMFDGYLLQSGGSHIETEG